METNKKSQLNCYYSSPITLKRIKDINTILKSSSNSKIISSRLFIGWTAELDSIQLLYSVKINPTLQDSRLLSSMLSK